MDIRALSLLVVAVGGASVARAEDVSSPVSSQEGAAHDGFYVGSTIGAGSTAFDWSLVGSSDRFSGPVTGSAAGIFGGYNLQSGLLVVGLEVEATRLFGSSNFSSVPGPTDLGVTVLWQASAKGRLGYEVGQFLPYVTAGVTAARVSTQWPYADVGYEDVSETHTGVVYGAGLEMLVDEFILRLEYTHSTFSTERYSYCLGGCLGDIRIDHDAVRLGIGYQF